MKKLFLVFLLLLATPAWAQWSVLGSTGKASTNNNSVTTDAADTSGANRIWIGISAYTLGCTPTDSKSNSWTGLTPQNEGTNGSWAQIWVSGDSPTVGSGHTFTCNENTTYPSIHVIWASGSANSPTDQQNGATGVGVTSIQPGSITPTEDNEIVLVLTTHGQTGGTTINSGFTEATDIDFTANSMGGTFSYLIQTTAAAVNPTISFSSGNPATAIASFKAAAFVSGGSSMSMTGVGR